MAHTCLATFSLTDMTNIVTNLETKKILKFHCARRHTVNYLFVTEVSKLGIVYLVIYVADLPSSVLGTN